MRKCRENSEGTVLINSDLQRMYHSIEPVNNKPYCAVDTELNAKGIAKASPTAFVYIQQRDCITIDFLLHGFSHIVTVSCAGGGRLTINVSSLAVLTVGGLLVLQGRLAVGAMLAVNVYNTFLAVGLAQLAGSLGDLGKSLGSLQRCACRHARPPLLTMTKPLREGVTRVSGVEVLLLKSHFSGWGSILYQSYHNGRFDCSCVLSYSCHAVAADYDNAPKKVYTWFCIGRI